MAGDKSSIWSTKVIVATAIMVVSGTMNTISFKFQNQYNYKHSFVQTSLMFVGEFLNLIIFGAMLVSDEQRSNHFRELRSDAAKGNKSMQCSKIRMGMAAAFDSVGSLLQIGSLLLIPASV